MRSGVGKLQFLTQEHPEVLYELKQCASMSHKGNTITVGAPKHLLRYFQGQKGSWQFLTLPEEATVEDAKFLDVYVDSDLAGNPVTRKSTSCDVLDILCFTFEVNVYGQTVLADSSGTAELIGICSGATAGLGLQIKMREFGLELQLRIRTDSSAARAVCHRLGHTSRTKRMEIRHLFIQALVRDKKAFILRNSTRTNQAAPSSQSWQSISAR